MIFMRSFSGVRKPGFNHFNNLDIVVNDHACRINCGACCIAPSISSAIPGMPNGKPAGVRCIQLDQHNLCKIFGHSERPAVCQSLKPSNEMCGETQSFAMMYLTKLERMTSV